MNCLVIAATGAEISPFLEWLKTTSQPLEIDVLITGVGLTASTYSLTRQVSIKRPAVVIQAGIAGSFNKNIIPGTVVAVKQDRIADLGVTESGKFRTVFDLGLASPGKTPYSKGWLVNKSEILARTWLQKVKAVSVNEISTNKKKIEDCKAAFDPAVESMEGAALHYVCLLEKIPFLQLRGISNYIGERNKQRWKMKESIINLNKELIHLLESL